MNTPCHWNKDEHTCSWDTSCANKFQFTNDGPKENGFKFCPYCGDAIMLAGDQQPESAPTQPPTVSVADTINTGGSADRRMVRLDCDTGKIPEVPQDDYMPVWNYEPVRESAGDSMAMGHWVWRKVFVGYVGAITGVMLGPEWADILEVTPEPNGRS